MKYKIYNNKKYTINNNKVLLTNLQKYYYILNEEYPGYNLDVIEGLIIQIERKHNEI